jgi:glycosyltransferase involved in cell wall biosynthesis
LARILVNGVKAKTGGGRSILRTLVSLISQGRGRPHEFFVLTPDRQEYDAFAGKDLTIVDLPKAAKHNLLLPLLYYHYFPRLLGEYRIEAILNLGDIVIPTDVPQLYNFDWPHAVYPESPAWRMMSRFDRTVSRIKLKMFSTHLHRASLIMAQTEVMADRLRRIYGLDNIVLVPNAVSPEAMAGQNEIAFDLPDGKTRFLYLTHYYPHKNLEILIPAARLIRDKGLSFVIVTTVSADQHPGAAAFLSTVTDEDLARVIVNLGPVEMSDVSSLYRQCDALLMPTLLETFGAPYVEAMFHKRPILTSDLDFAHYLCGEAAQYFNPCDASSLVAAMEQLNARPDLREAQVASGARRLAEMWDWQQVFEQYVNLLEGLVRR